MDRDNRWERVSHSPTGPSRVAKVPPQRRRAKHAVEAAYAAGVYRRVYQAQRDRPIMLVRAKDGDGFFCLNFPRRPRA